MTTTSDTLLLLDKATAYWYACGYNDHRDGDIAPYCDPHAFAEHWIALCARPSRPSMQDAFQQFAFGVECTRCHGNEVITVAVDGPDYWGNYDTDEVACPECQGDEE